jgi:hypothetical protein
MRSRIRTLSLAVGLACLSAAVLVQSAFAAADPTTGIDYQTDVATPAMSAMKPAIIAGLAVFVLFVAIAGGKKLWGKVTGTR